MDKSEYILPMDFFNGQCGAIRTEAREKLSENDDAAFLEIFAQMNLPLKEYFITHDVQTMLKQRKYDSMRDTIQLRVLAGLQDTTGFRQLVLRGFESLNSKKLDDLLRRHADTLQNLVLRDCCQLTMLGLSNKRFGGKVVLPQLRLLDVRGCEGLSNISLKNSECPALSKIIGVTVFADWAEPLEPNVTEAKLGNEAFKPKNRKLLTRILARHQTLTSLNLADKNVHSAGANALAKSLKVNQVLTSLDLSDTLINPKGICALAASLEVNQTLMSLNLSDNFVMNTGASALAASLKINQALTSLDLEYNGIRSVGAKALAMSLKTNQTLTYLNLKFNCIKHAGATALAESLKTNQTLTSLNLGSNEIKDTGVKALAVSLKTNQTLASLNLMGAGITDTGVRALITSLNANQGMTSLTLFGCRRRVCNETFELLNEIQQSSAKNLKIKI